MIHFDQESKVFYLENKTVTYAFRVAYGHLEHLYFGAKIGRDDLSYTRTVQAQVHDAWLGEKGDGKEPKAAGFTLTPAMMEMMGGFTLLRLAGMIGMVNVTITKEELLKINRKLNRIKVPKKK